jgi:hypothetical protein
MNLNVECIVKFFKKDDIISTHNITLKNYKNMLVFDKFKKNIIQTAYSNGNDLVKLIFNNEEYIIFYIKYSIDHLLITVYKALNNLEKEYIETLKFNGNSLVKCQRTFGKVSANLW